MVKIKSQEELIKEVNADKDLQPVKKSKPLSVKLADNVIAMGQDPEDVKTHFLQATTRTPELMSCKPETLFLAVSQVMKDGLSLNPDDAEVALIPYQMGMTKVAQRQTMWKGYRKILLRDAEGVKDLLWFEVKEGDIKTWNVRKGEMTYNEAAINETDFTKVMERRKKETIGFAAVIIVNPEIYGQENFGLFMSNEDIEEHRAEYSNTKLNNLNYGRKTVIKKVIRDYEFFLKYKNKETIREVLKTDQTVTDEHNKIHYVEGNNNE